MREEHKGLHSLGNGQNPLDKTLAAISLLYSQVLITMNSSRVYIRARGIPTWAYNILGLLGNFTLT